MGRNHEVITEQFLLDENGELREPGWSRRMVQKYRKGTEMAHQGMGLLPCAE